MHAVCICVCVTVFGSVLPRTSSSLCLSIVSNLVFSGSGRLAAAEDNADGQQLDN